MTVDLTQFHQAFFEECTLCLDQAEQDALSLEKGHNCAQSIDSLFRAIHSIKGSGGTLGFRQIGDLSHQLESKLDLLRQDEQVNANGLTTEQTSIILAELDQLRVALDTAQGKGSLANPAPKEKNSLSMDGSSSTNRFQIKFRPFDQLLAQGADPLRYLDSLAKLGTLKTLALLDEAALELDECAYRCGLSWDIALESTCSKTDIRQIFEWIEDECELLIEELDLSPASPVLGQPADEAADTSKLDDALFQEKTGSAERLLQVRSNKLDELLSLLTDLTHAQLRLQAELEKGVDKASLKAHLQSAERQIRQIQESTLSLRMAPIRQLFQRFDRLVRDARSQFGKQIQIQIEGEDQELDSTMIDALVDPVTHLVRNAIDHGIESPSERDKYLKPRVAKLLLSAKQTGSRFTIEIQDDGKGIDIPAIREKAIAQQLVGPNEKLSDQAWASMIFKPGFSTAQKLSQWSGRGVGLDAVVNCVQTLRGEISVQSSAGQGTKFRIELPLTLAVTEVLVFQVMGELFAVSTQQLETCLPLKTQKIVELEGGERLLQHGEQLLRLVDSQIFLYQQRSAFNQQEHVLVLRSGETRYGLSVDTVVGLRNIVVKGTEKTLGKIRGIAGVSDFGQGELAFVLDPNTLIEQEKEYLHA